MILIISSNDDYSTSSVIDWLRFSNQQFIRISSSYPIQIETIDPNNPGNCTFWVKRKKYKLSDITYVWYRRSWLVLDKYELTDFPEVRMKNSINSQLKTESDILLNLFLNTLRKKSLNSQLDNYLSKLDELQICSKYNIKTPSSIITTNKDELLDFFIKNKRQIITKNFSQGIFIESNKTGFITSTKIVDEAMITSLDDNFYPMYFQEMIPKSFEIRSFFLDGKFYSSAIFSQNDDKTKVDFRNYNREKPNRTPSFEIPQDLQKRLIRLMREFGLNSGSIDLLVTPEAEFYFLEVNPIGQFYQVSKPCNYNLEKLISNYLIRQSNVNQKNY